MVAAGITETLISALARVPGLSVFAGGSAAISHRYWPDFREASRADYLLAGSVQRSGQRLRVTARLVDGASGNCLWSDRYDCPVDGAFVEQDEIARKVLIDACARLVADDHAHPNGTTHEV